MADEKPSNHELQAVGITVTPVLGTAMLRVRSQLTWQHLSAAAKFSVKVGEIEANNPILELGPPWDEAFSYAAPCVISAAAGVEAYANQIFADRLTRFSKFPADILDDMWAEWIEKKPALEKLQMALRMQGVAELPRGATPYQSVAAVIALRNALVHFKPAWSDNPAEHKSITAALTPFASRSPYWPADAPIFPYAWSTHKTTIWAVSACIELVSKVSAALGDDPKLANRLQALPL